VPRSNISFTAVSSVSRRLSTAFFALSKVVTTNALKVWSSFSPWPSAPPASTGLRLPPSWCRATPRPLARHTHRPPRRAPERRRLRRAVLRRPGVGLLGHLVLRRQHRGESRIVRGRQSLGRELLFLEVLRDLVLRSLQRNLRVRLGSRHRPAASTCGVGARPPENRRDGLRGTPASDGAVSDACLRSPVASFLLLRDVAFSEPLISLPSPPFNELLGIASVLGITLAISACRSRESSRISAWASPPRRACRPWLARAPRRLLIGVPSRPSPARSPSSMPGMLLDRGGLGGEPVLDALVALDRSAIRAHANRRDHHRHG